MSTLPLSPAQEPDVPVIAPRGKLFETYLRAKGHAKGRASYALADQVVYSFGNLVVAALLGRHCAAREFGVYVLTQRAMDVLIQLSNVFLWAPFTFNLPGTPALRRASYQGSVLSLQMGFCVLFSLTLLGATRWSSQPGHADLHATFAALVLPSGAVLFREFTRRMYFAQMRLAEAFWTEVATVVLQIAGVLLLLRTGHLSVAAVLVVLGSGALLVSFWWVLNDWKGWSVHRAATVRDLRRNLKLGRWFLGSNMAFLASAQCNPWVLNAMLGGASVGSYAILESLVNIPRVALNSMQNVMGPSLARANAEGGKAAVRSAVRRFDRSLLLVTTASAIAIWAMGPFLAYLIYGKAPANTRTIVALLAINLVVFASTLAQSYGLTALNRADATFYANAAGALMQGCVCMLLVHSFAIAGAAEALLLGSLVVMFVRQRFYSAAVATV